MSFKLILQRQAGVKWAKVVGGQESIAAREKACVRALRQEKTGTFEESKEDHMVGEKNAK